MDLLQARNTINEKIADLEFGTHPPELYEPIRYMMTIGGKRMRPLLTLLGTYLFSEDYQKALLPAIGVEVFHNFTLVHDDIMDNAPLRRGKPTIYKKWSQNIAILSGDVMLIKAYELLMEVNDDCLRPLIEAFNRCAAEVCEGQQLDMNYEEESEVSEEKYLEMIRLKTAVLLGLSLEVGGIVAQTHPENLAHLRSFGQNLGIGFQLKDDLLDVYGDQHKFGKQVGGDIIANKKTFLLIKALEKAKGEEIKKLKHWLSLQEFDKLEKVQAITRIYDSLEIRALTEKKMNGYFEVAFSQLAAIEAEESKKLLLKKFTEEIINREK